MGRWLVARGSAAALVVSGACGRLAFDPGMPADATTDTTQLRRDCEGHEDAVFCDGFEDPALAKWTVYGQTQSMPLVEPAPPHGDRLLQTDTLGSMEASDVYTFITPIASGTLYVRGWFYVPSVSIQHFDLIDFNSPAGGGLTVLGYMGDLVLYESTAGTGSMHGPPMPTDRWVCLGLAIEVADPGSVSMTLDGSPVATFTGIDVVPGAGFEKIAIGIPWTDDGQPVTRVYTDEIIIDTRPIACD